MLCSSGREAGLVLRAEPHRDGDRWTCCSQGVLLAWEKVLRGEHGQALLPCTSDAC